MSTTTADPPECFTDETLHLWRQYPELNGRSRQRPSPEKLTFISEVLRGVYLGDATSCNKSHVRSRYRIANETLQYIPEDGRPPRTVINDDEAYGLIVESHLKYGHAGREKVFHYLKDKFYHVTREEVGWVLKQCAKCKARCKSAEAPYENSPDPAGDEDPAMAGMDGAAAEEEENYLPGAYTKKFNALRAESKLDESEWMNLCLCVARDVRGPTGLDVMLENEDKGKAWDEHFSPLCDIYAERHWGTKTKGRWWAGDRAGDHILIKDFLRRLFMNFFQKERVHRARIARKAAKGKRSDAPSSGPGGAGGGPSGGTTWMRSHPPIKIPATQQSHTDQDNSSPCAQKGLSKKRQREMDPTSLHYTSANQVDGEPSHKNPRLERIMVLLSNAEKEQADEPPPDTTTHTHTRKRNTASTIHHHSPVSLEPTPHAVFRLDPIGAVFPPIPPPSATTTASGSTSNTPTTPQISDDLLFMTYVQRDERRHEIRLIRGDSLTPLPFTGVLEKLRKKHRLGARQVITAVVLDFKGKKLCIEAEDEDCQCDWETWVRVEGPNAKQVEMEVKVAEMVG
ncbi:uncharacterized protein H6S33_003220 [Morchella sextelata]|uniref:uncharacterized protein n=1 Tax=Morchella sextelata TaxID=1174677 RepID=UPI001D049ECD|nr:uncharacterized protein H6S33_003220 [Morchella sextelata]KAH0607232.1 hypothetical protein H6S33_003220 [Morchella sextelata]